MKQFNVENAMKWTMKCLTEAFLDNVKCHKYTEVNNDLVYELLAETDCFIKK